VCRADLSSSGDQDAISALLALLPPTASSGVISSSPSAAGVPHSDFLPHMRATELLHQLFHALATQVELARECSAACAGNPKVTTSRCACDDDLMFASKKTVMA